MHAHGLCCMCVSEHMGTCVHVCMDVLGGAGGGTGGCVRAYVCPRVHVSVVTNNDINKIKSTNTA